MTSVLLAVGRITRAHGVRGEVAVQPLTEVTSRFEEGSVLLLGPDGERHLTVRSSRPHRNRVLIAFEEIPDRTEAESLRGRLLLANAATSPALETGRYWTHQVVGLEVVTDQGQRLGRVTEVLHNPANDVWVVANGKEILVPALRDVVEEVDLAAGRAVVRETPGLLEGWDDA
ncbi:MAG: ribosome maturation factor RimM [Actinomycetota bacterium]